MKNTADTPMNGQAPADGSETGLPSKDRDPGTVAGGHRPISLYTIERLSVYRRTLEELSDEGVEFVFSHQLASQAGVSAAQLRRDLASFGSFGNVARGYNVREMDRTIGRIIGTDVPQTIALFGLGDLGRALLSYRGFEERGFNITAVFETDPEKVGRIFAGRRCYGLESIEVVVPQFDIHIAILASRPEGLQNLVDRTADVGVRSFLNFVPKRVNTPPNCFIEHMDISSKLEKLSFLSRRNDEPKCKA